MQDCSPRLLIIEDDRTVAAWFGTLFRRFGFVVGLAADGVVGLSMVREQCPDVVVLDYNLPGAHGGVVLETLRRERTRSQLSIVMVSGDFDLDVPGLLEAGLDAFLPKDTDGLQLLSTVRTVLENRTISERAAARHGWRTV